MENEKKELLESMLEKEIMENEKKELWKSMIAKEIHVDSSLWVSEVHPGRTLAHDAAYLRLLPVDFKYYFLKDDRNLTVAQVSEMRGRPLLLKESEQFLLEQEEIIFEEIGQEAKKLIINLLDWHAPASYWLTQDGRPLAHDAARLGVLPKGFSYWFVHDELGWNTAQEADYWGLLPRNVIIGRDDIPPKDSILLPLMEYEEIFPYIGTHQPEKPVRHKEPEAAITKEDIDAD